MLFIFQQITFACVCLVIIALSRTNAAAVKPKFVKFDLEIHDQNSLMKRGYDKTTFSDQQSYYLATVQIGSNKQSSQLLVDSGSSDMYTIDSASCSTCSRGTFHKQASSTFKSISGSFLEYYGSGKALGTWGSDSVSIGGISIPNQRFAIATTYPKPFGVFGIGFSPDTIGQSPSYASFPKNLKTQGHISKVAYSFYAGNYGDNRGHLLFGAVDMAKVNGGLFKLNMINVHPSTSSHATTNTLKLSGINLDSSYASVKSKVLTSASVNVLLDTGTSITFIPTLAMNNLVTSLKATKTGGSYYVDCGLINQNIKINFNFSGVHIKTPLKNLIYQESATTCLLGIQGSDSLHIFGANALRSAYVVFDMEDYLIYLGQSNEDTAAENIKVITKTVPTS